MSDASNKVPHSSTEDNLQLFAAVLDATSTGVVITDNQQPDNPIIYCNQAFQTLSGYKRSEIIGRNCRFLQGDDRQQEARKAIREALEQHKSLRVELRNYRKDGTLFWNELIVSPIKNEVGVVTHFVGVQTDISRRKQAEAALQNEKDRMERQVEDRTKSLAESKQYLESIVQTIRESLLVLEKDLTVVSANQYFYKSFKVQPEDTVGKKVYELGNGQWNIPDLRRLLEEVLPANNPFEGFEVEHEFPHIGKRLFILNARQIELEGEFKDRILLALEDFTEAKEAERRKDDFLSIASHELKTPLTSIKGYLQIIQDQFGEHIPNGITAILQKAESHTDRLSHLIADLLDVSKIQSGQLEFNFSNFNFDEMVANTIESIQTTTNTHRIIFNGKTGKDLIGDKERLQQVVENLLTNAIKYSPDSAEVNVHIGLVSNFLKVSIQDYGVGIDKKDQKKIFERFYRVDKVQKQYPGMGIGLYVCEQIINKHGGTLWVESEIGQGSTFNFTLPLSPKQPD